MFIVADGMGPHEVAATAALAAVHALSRRLRESDVSAHAMELALRAADDEVRAVCGVGAPTGSTVVAVAVDGLRCVVGWAGDSRLLLVRGGRTWPLTRDDRLDSGPGRASNQLTNRLGGPGVAARTEQFNLASGDRLVLLSDGVHDQLSAERIAALAGIRDPQVAAWELARGGQGRDDATALVVDTREEVAEPAEISVGEIGADATPLPPSVQSSSVESGRVPASPAPPVGSRDLPEVHVEILPDDGDATGELSVAEAATDSRERPGGLGRLRRLRHPFGSGESREPDDS
jgi:serine/threonine protein phosphatase PrpC